MRLELTAPKSPTTSQCQPCFCELGRNEAALSGLGARVLSKACRQPNYAQGGDTFLGCMFGVRAHIAVYMYFIVWDVPRYTCTRTSVKVSCEHRHAHMGTHVCMCKHPCHSTCVETRGRLVGVDSLIGPHGFQNQTLIDRQSWKEATSPEHPSFIFWDRVS